VAGLRTIKNGKRVVGILLGMVAFIEGLFAIYIAKPTEFNGLGGVDQSTFVLAGAQLAVIGGAMILVWALFKDKRIEGILGKILPIIMLLASALMVVEGVAAIFLSSDLVVGGTQVVSKKYMAIAGVQLFIIGMTQLCLWMRQHEEKDNWLFHWVAMFFTIVLFGEGLYMAGISAEITVSGLGTISREMVFLLGLQMSLISGTMLIMQMFREKGIFADRLGKGRMNVIFTILSLVMVLEGLFLAFYSEQTVLAYSNSQADGFGKFVIAMVAAQMVAISLVVFSSWKLIDLKPDRKALAELFGMVAGIALTAEGAFLIGIAGRTKILNDIGGIKSGTFMAAGFGLAIVGMLILFCWYFRNQRIIKKVFGRERLDIFLVALGLMIGIGGVLMSALSAKVVIDGVGSISAKYIELAGIQLILLATVVVLMWAFQEGRITERIKRVSYMVALFMMLLVPPAILM
jgi:hypothetical protein